MNLNEYAHDVHVENKKWWYDPATGNALDRNFGEMIALCHSELSEALEGHRKNLQDDHLPQYKMADVELIDCMIRLFDLLDARGVNVEEVFWAKMAYNRDRADHKLENRLLPGGKAY
jgi:hypothetical protein